MMFPATSLVCSFSGCSDRSQQLENRVADLKQTVQQLRAKLEGAKQPGEQERSSSASAPATALPTKERLESSYETSSKELRDKINAKLNGFTVENYTTHSVQMPEEIYPFTSKISFSIRSDDGKTYQMDLPVKADYAGKWVFPDADEVVARINSAKNVTPITEKEAASNSAVPGEETAQNRPPIMNVDGTIVIQWGDSEKPKASTARASDSISTRSANQPLKPGAAAISSTQAPSVIKPPVMPVDRDVHINFSPPPK
jgi:hypothetical protein